MSLDEFERELDKMCSDIMQEESKRQSKDNFIKDAEAWFKANGIEV